MAYPKPRLVVDSDTLQVRDLPPTHAPSEPPRSLSKPSFPPPAPRLIPGHRLDRYELLCPIAQGGMAQVWVARIQGVHGFEKLVAVKTILAEYASDPHYEAMFLDEARLIANIHHHNVAEILDLGSHDSLLYLVLEWIEGDSLALLERSASKNKRPIPLPVGLRIVAQMCAGLNAAHDLRDRSGRRLNVVHRDVSPQNVLISITGEVKLIDFGIAKALDQMSTDTNTGVLKGKISFMSPEQALGQRLDCRADIWSAGVVLYQLLSGELPFRGAGQLDTLHIIGSGKRPPPIPGLPTILQKLLDRMLEPKRELRIGNAGELEAELERVASQLGTATTRDVAAVVQEHLGRRVAARRETIDTALRAADGRQRLTQVFNAALERARQGDDSSSDALAPSPEQLLETPRVIPSLSLLASLEPSLTTLTARNQPSLPAPRPAGAPPPSPPLSARPLSARAPSTPAIAPSAPPAPRLRAIMLGAAAMLAAAALSAWLTRRAASAPPGATPNALYAAANPAPPPVPVIPAATRAAAPSASTAQSVAPAPTVQASDLPLAKPTHATAAPVAHRPRRATAAAPASPPAAPAVSAAAAPQQDVWSAFSEHR